MNLFGLREAVPQAEGQAHQLGIRDALELASRTLQMEGPSIVRRATSSSSACSKSQDSDTCEKPTDNSVALPVALGIACVYQAQ